MNEYDININKPRTKFRRNNFRTKEIHVPKNSSIFFTVDFDTVTKQCSFECRC